jgi:pyruvate dehydrogenase E2 component (dihydrolipoamide acetyltransferase)
MPVPVIMPKQGQSVETCIITQWFKKKGDKVAEGDLLFSYETDKAAFDMEAPGSGILLDIFFAEGSEVPVLGTVAVLGQPGEAWDAISPAATASAKPSDAAETSLPEKKKEQPAVNKITEPQNDEKIKVSPRARKLAILKGIQLSGIKGSGPNGRIMAADIESAAVIPDAGVTTAAGEESTLRPVTNVRKLIAKAMHASIQNSAQLTHHLSADVRRLLEARKTIKADLAAGREKQDLTLNDMICWCVIRALKKHPELNSHFLGDTVKLFNTVHLGIAVDTPRGLMVPAVRNAGNMDLRTLSAGLKSVAEACRKGSIDPELIKSTAASFTVSNLGNYGVEMFTPVINLPQVAILGVCTIIHRPADLGNNTFGFIPYIGLSLTYDHRAVDGGPATLFLKEIKEEIEKFTI